MKTLALLSFAASLVACVAAPATGEEIVVTADTLTPVVSRVALDDLVTFVNRSGRSVHVEFIGPAGEHHVFEIRGSIRAEFHRAGEHPYVVHFYAGRPAELRGVVRVDGPASSLPTRECIGVTVEDTCLDR